jgi:hypothetical protein
MPTPVSRDVLNHEANVRFWLQIGYRPLHLLDPNNPTDKAMMPVWWHFYNTVKDEADAGKLVTTYDDPEVQRALADAAVAHKAAAAYVDTAVNAPNGQTQQQNITAATTAQQISTQKLREAAAKQPPSVNPQLVKDAGQQAANNPPPPEAPASEHIWHEHAHRHAHEHAQAVHAQARTQAQTDAETASSVAQQYASDGVTKYIGWDSRYPTRTVPGGGIYRFGSRAEAKAWFDQHAALPGTRYVAWFDVEDPAWPSAVQEAGNVPSPPPVRAPGIPPAPSAYQPPLYPPMMHAPYPPYPRMQPRAPMYPPPMYPPPMYPPTHPPMPYRPPHERGHGRARGRGEYQTASQASMGPPSPGGGPSPGGPSPGGPMTMPVSSSEDETPPPPSSLEGASSGAPSGSTEAPPSDEGLSIGAYIAIGVAVIGGGGLLYYASTRKPNKSSSRSRATRSSIVRSPPSPPSSFPAHERPARAPRSLPSPSAPGAEA